MNRLRQSAPAWCLFLLAPMVGELLSGSSPPTRFFSPPALVVLAVLYGGGALLIREARLRWNKGWPTVLALGAAYGLTEEGLMVKSLFDPHWPGLGDWGAVGRAWGVNWIWGLNLTIYHAIFSIAIPILLIELAFPGRQADSWVGRRTKFLLGALFIGDVLLGFSEMTSYRPPAPQYVLTLLAVAGLIALAGGLPGSLVRATSSSFKTRGPAGTGLAAFLGTVAFFGVAWGLPASGLPPWLLAGATAGVLAGTCFAVVTLTGGGRGLGPVHRLSLAGGALGFFILLSPLQEFGRGAPGMTLVGLAFVGILVWIGRRVHHAGTHLDPSAGPLAFIPRAGDPDA